MWDNAPETHSSFDRLKDSLTEKKITDISYYIGKFAFNYSETYCYYYTPDCKLMRVETMWTTENRSFSSLMKLLWEKTIEL